GVNEPRERIHQYPMAGRGFQIHDDIPVTPYQVIDPVIMSDDDLAVSGPAAGSNECRARGRRRLVQSGIAEAGLQRWHVVLSKLDPGIQCQNVVDIDPELAVTFIQDLAFAGTRDEAGVRAASYARDLALVLVADLVPKEGMCRVSIELPIAPGRMGQVLAEDSEGLFYLRSKPVAMLVANLIRCSLQMNIDPPIPVTPKRRAQQVWCWRARPGTMRLASPRGICFFAGKGRGAAERSSQ